MTVSQKSSWWSRASTEQKLAQIDGGISCGMSGRHIAMNVGATRAAVLEFGRRHGRKFVAKATASQRQTAGRIAGVEAARRTGKPDYDISSAFSIFGGEPTDRPFIDEVAA
jgi:hypothetical protein